MVQWPIKFSLSKVLWGLWGFIGALGLSSKLFAGANLARDGLYFSLRQEGLNILSQEIKQRILLPIHKHSLPNIREKVGYGVTAKAQGMHFSLDFDDLKLELAEGKLQMLVAVKNIDIRIPRLHASKKFITTISTTCYDTQILIARQKSLFFTAAMPLHIQDEQILLDLQEGIFDIPAEHFQVLGPKSCTGILGTGKIIRSIVHQVLENARRKINDAILAQIAKATPLLAKELNQLTHQRLDLSSQGLPGLPRLQAYIDLAPQTVQISKQKLDFIFRATPGSANAATPSKDTSSTLIDAPTPSLLGQVGINPLLIEEFLAVWVKLKGQNVFPELNQLADLSAMLHREKAQHLWPELKNRPLQQEQLKLRLSFTTAPQFVYEPASQSFLLSISQMQWTFMVLEAEGWQDYYDLFVDFTASIKPELDQDLLHFTLSSSSDFSWQGNWSEGINPAMPEVNGEAITELLGLAKHHWLKPMTPLYSMYIPTFYLGGSYLEMGSMQYEDPFLSLEVRSTRF